MANIDIQPLLTIAIPTYNRAVTLELCLERLNEELESLSAEYRQRLKIYISNNSSTDNTCDVISKSQLKSLVVYQVVSNTENIGGERNVAQCYSAANTPYVWVLGDDDVILQSGLEKVLSTLLRTEVDILYLGHYWFKDDYRIKPGRGEKQGVSIYSDTLKFARRAHVMLTFISGLIVKIDINSAQKMSRVDGSNLPQMGLVLPLLRDGKCFAIIEDWVVAAKGSNSGGYGLVKVFGKSLQKITADILKDKPDVARAIQNGTIVNFFPSFILEFRKGASQFSDNDMACGLKAAFEDNWRYYAFLVPLVFLPIGLARFYYYLIRLLRLILGRHLI